MKVARIFLSCLFLSSLFHLHAINRGYTANLTNFTDVGDQIQADYKLKIQTLDAINHFLEQQLTTFSSSSTAAISPFITYTGMGFENEGDMARFRWELVSSNSQVQIGVMDLSTLLTQVYQSRPHTLGKQVVRPASQHVLFCFFTFQDNSQSPLSIIIVDKDALFATISIGGNSAFQSPRSLGSSPKAFPNPIQDQTTLSFTQIQAGPVSVHILDPRSGKIIEQPLRAVWFTPGSHQLRINTNTWPNGTYYALIEQDGFTKVIALLRQAKQ